MGSGIGDLERTGPREVCRDWTFATSSDSRSPAAELLLFPEVPCRTAQSRSRGKPLRKSILTRLEKVAPLARAQRGGRLGLFQQGLSSIFFLFLSLNRLLQRSRKLAQDQLQQVSQPVSTQLHLRLEGSITFGSNSRALRLSPGEDSAEQPPLLR